MTIDCLWCGEPFEPRHGAKFCKRHRCKQSAEKAKGLLAQDLIDLGITSYRQLRQKYGDVTPRAARREA